MNNEYEESIKKEFEAVEGINVEATEEKTTDLGNVDPNRFRRVDPDDPEVRRLNDLVGYICHWICPCFLLLEGSIEMTLRSISEPLELLRSGTFRCWMKAV